MSANVRHSAASNEHFTPPSVIAVARETLERIDLDPASCELANGNVRAARIFTKDDDGLSRAWAGRVFCNPPGGKESGDSLQKAFWFKLAREFSEGRVEAACFLSFSIELLQTTQVDPPRGVPLPHDFPFCLPARRVAYLRERAPGEQTSLSLVGVDDRLEVGDSPPHASALFCLTRDEATLARFERAAARLGRVVNQSAAAKWLLSDVRLAQEFGGAA